VSAAPSISLHLLPDAPNADGEPRAALLLPPTATAIDRRPLLRVFGSVGAALAMKRAMEGGKA